LLCFQLIPTHLERKGPENIFCAAPFIIVGPAGFIIPCPRTKELISLSFFLSFGGAVFAEKLKRVTSFPVLTCDEEKLLGLPLYY